MEFDKSKVYTAVNADELKVGSKVYVSDNVYYLRECVEENFGHSILTKIMSEKETKRFCINNKNNEKWQLVYLIEPPADMNSKQSKKLRKQYKKALNAKAQSTLKRTIFSLARKRDLIGVIAIIEAVIIVILLFIK
ncbi:hypothetical protein [Treponema sp.]|uniref:hypothetical protein n=1 Tax=Treponema sp. TaxID=166 RepID=UPI003FA31D79